MEKKKKWFNCKICLNSSFFSLFFWQVRKKEELEVKSSGKRATKSNQTPAKMLIHVNLILRIKGWV